MPWEIRSTRHSVHVRITAPVPPIQDVLRGIAKVTTEGVRAVYLPTAVANGTLEDDAALKALWGAVMDAGYVVQRETQNSDSESSF